MRICGVCLVAVHGRVEAEDVKTAGVPNGGS